MICAVGVFASWPQVNAIAQGMGAKPIAYDPMLDYWPPKFAVAIPWFGWLMILEGIILLISGLRLGIGPFPFYGDVAACFVGGIGIVALARYAETK
jgi:hypothetical protein